MANVLAVVVTSPPSHVPSDDTMTELCGRARSAFTRLRCGAQVTQNRSSCQTKRCITPTGHPVELVHATTHSVCASYRSARLAASTPTPLTSA